MSDYTPTTEEVRAAFSEMSGWDMSAVEADAAFDRWIAALRAVWEAERDGVDVAALRAARAETWDEAIATIFAWWNAPEDERPAVVVNPYGAGLPVDENGSER